ncbi:MAG: NAD(+)/NADH kinase [Bacteroidales bacterium]|nr:NAD(+)/NADH kinase [Bacteroidales bacterium]
MKVAIYIKNERLSGDPRLEQFISALDGAGVENYMLRGGYIEEGTSLSVALGGDGTFLSCADLTCRSGVPVLGVNLGRVGFLTENNPEDAVKAIAEGTWFVEDLSILDVRAPEVPHKEHFAINEVSVHRDGAAMLGVEVSVNSCTLPTYWADGLIVATSSGSTAYALSAGGPIIVPGSRVLEIVPIAPHNLNVRPLVVPDNSIVELRFHSRDGKVRLGMDNRGYELDADSVVKVSLAQYSLKRARLEGANFVKALTGKLFWGEDLRNSGRGGE